MGEKGLIGDPGRPRPFSVNLCYNVIMRQSNHCIRKKPKSMDKNERGVSRVHSTKRHPFQRNEQLKAPIGKEQIHRAKLPPHFVVGFIEGEGSFSVTIRRDEEYQRGVQVRPEFELELRADDQEILERLLVTIGCGKIYDCSYDRYGWYPHVKYKITNAKDLEECFFPFLDKYQLQGKKATVYKLFRQIVLMYRRKEHLTDEGFEKIVKLREIIRSLGKNIVRWKPLGYGKTVRPVV